MERDPSNKVAPTSLVSVVRFFFFEKLVWYGYQIENLKGENLTKSS
jgi:hypothetical protein